VDGWTALPSNVAPARSRASHRSGLIRPTHGLQGRHPLLLAIRQDLFSLSDNFFSSVANGGFPGRLPDDSRRYVTDVPSDAISDSVSRGCDARPGTLVETGQTRLIPLRPAVLHVEDADPVHSTNTTFRSVAQPPARHRIHHGQRSPRFTRSVWPRLVGDHVVSTNRSSKDAASGNLPAVTWLVPSNTDWRSSGGRSARGGLDGSSNQCGNEEPQTLGQHCNRHTWDDYRRSTIMSRRQPGQSAYLMYGPPSARRSFINTCVRGWSCTSTASLL